jgi:hypothetical protein
MRLKEYPNLSNVCVYPFYSFSVSPLTRARLRMSSTHVTGRRSQEWESPSLDGQGVFVF